MTASQKQARADRVAPTLGDRLSSVLRPGWAHAAMLRRVLAVLLTALGVALMLRGNPDAVRTPVVVAAHDVAPGRLLTADDTRVVYRAAGTLPSGALRDPNQVAGRTLAAAVRAGETLTDIRLLGPRLAAAATGDANARIVPLRLADAGVAELLREGDRVDVVATVDDAGIPEQKGIGDNSAAPPEPKIIAADAMVVLVSDPQSGPRNAGKDRVVLLAMGAQPAITVAAASLSSALTVLFH